MKKVTQEDIVEYIGHNPGMSENQIMENLYGFYRKNTWTSNKKYSECLRRALKSGKIRREMVQGKPYKYVYFKNESKQETLNSQYITPTQMIQGKWYNGKTEQNWLFKFNYLEHLSSSDEYKVWVYCAATPSDGYKSKGPCSYLSNVRNIKPATKDEVKHLYPDEPFFEEEPQTNPNLIISLPEVRQRLSDLVKKITENFKSDMLLEISLISKSDRGMDDKLDEIKSFQGMAENCVTWEEEALKRINNEKLTLFEICSWLTDQDEVWGLLFENEQAILEVILGQKVEYKIKNHEN